MPIKPGCFDYIPEFMLSAPRFFRRLANNEYDTWMTADSVPTTDEPLPMPRNLTTFSDDIQEVCARTHNYLLHLALRRAPDRFLSRLSSEQLVVLHLYTMNSVPFHAITRCWRLQAEYDDIDPAYIARYFPNQEVGLRTVSILSSALTRIGLLNSEEYDVSYWTQGYSGMMVFRGALTAPNPSQGSGTIYDYNGSIRGDRIIRVNDIVANTDFMSTSAHPSVAAEFVVRQTAPWVPGMDATISVDAHFRRVFFRIDMLSGRLIVPMTQLNQAEILFPLFSLFRVTSIEADPTYGLLVALKELTPEEKETVTEAKNIMTGEDVIVPKLSRGAK